MEAKNHIDHMIIRTRDCDGNGTWKPSAMLEAMQEAAGSHCDRVGVGRNDLLKMNIAWVITRMEVHVTRYPRIGEAVSVETFHTPPHHWMFPRYFVCRDAAGEVIVCATSLWVLLDLETRKLTRAQSVVDMMTDNSDVRPPLGLPGAAAELACEGIEMLTEPVYTDLDANAHVNNTRYMDWCCNAIGIDRMSRQELATFTVNYNHEILPGQVIRTELKQDSDAFSFTGSHEGERCFGVSGTFRDRH